MHPRIIRRRIHPPEAAVIAGNFRSAASQIYQLVADVERAARQLEPTWEGNSKERFFADYAPTTDMLRNCASELEHLASEIEHITVEIEVIQNG